MYLSDCIIEILLINMINLDNINIFNEKFQTHKVRGNSIMNLHIPSLNYNNHQGFITSSSSVPSLLIFGLSIFKQILGFMSSLNISVCIS